MTFQKQSIKSYFLLFLLIHLILWTAIPSLIRDNLPLDSMECLAWGHEWQMGYYKHPPLSSWLSEAFFEASQRNMWSIYLLSQIAVCLAFIANWQLAQKFLPQSKAFLATILLEGLHFYNFSSPEFNPNVLTLPIAAWFNYFAWQSLEKNHLRSWLILAIISALGILTKYSFLLHLAAFGMLLLFDQKNLFRRLKNPHFYLAILLFLALIFPHLIWLKQHDFLPFSYVKESSGGNHRLVDHILNPLGFIISNLMFLAPILLNFLPIGRIKKTEPTNIRKNLELLILEPKTQPKLFLLFVGLGPFLLLNFQSLLTGGDIKDMWSYGFWNMIGILLFYFWQSDFHQQKLKKFWIIWSFWAFVAIASYLASNVIKPDKYSLFNGSFIAQKIENSWHQHFERPLAIVAGDIWLAGNLGIFLQNRPSVFIDLDEQAASWTSFKKLRELGGVVIWDSASYETNPPHDLLEKLTKNGLKIISWEIIPQSSKTDSVLKINSPNDLKTIQSKEFNDFSKIFYREIDEMRNFNRNKFLVGFAIVEADSITKN